jgi:hypothetical protein
VSASTHSHLKHVRSREIKSDHDILSTNTAPDDCRTAVNEGVETAASYVVLGIRGDNDSAS